MALIDQWIRHEDWLKEQHTPKMAQDIFNTTLCLSRYKMPAPSAFKWEDGEINYCWENKRYFMEVIIKEGQANVWILRDRYTDQCLVEDGSTDPVPRLFADALQLFC
jgi:hypothetical protein